MSKPARLLACSTLTLLALGYAGDAIASPWSGVHQGRLFDDTDAPVSGTLSVTFAVYDAAVDGNLLWTETVDVDFDEGYYSVALGENAPFDDFVFDGSVRYLGVAVGNDEEMSPRAPIHSVPYAMIAQDAVGDINPNSISIP